MADVADIANDVEQERMQRILSSRPQQINQVSAIDCEECGAPIPEARRLVLPGVITCVHCQTLNEDSAKWRQ
jgi:phage/conjugal plasmid C-4 type zinc finger TraR family protein